MSKRGKGSTTEPPNDVQTRPEDDELRRRVASHPQPDASESETNRKEFPNDLRPMVFKYLIPDELLGRKKQPALLIIEELIQGYMWYLRPIPSYEQAISNYLEVISKQESFLHVVDAQTAKSIRPKYQFLKKYKGRDVDSLKRVLSEHNAYIHSAMIEVSSPVTASIDLYHTFKPIIVFLQSVTEGLHLLRISCYYSTMLGLPWIKQFINSSFFTKLEGLMINVGSYVHPAPPVYHVVWNNPVLAELDNKHKLFICHGNGYPEKVVKISLDNGNTDIDVQRAPMRRRPWTPAPEVTFLENLKDEYGEVFDDVSELTKWSRIGTGSFLSLVVGLIFQDVSPGPNNPPPLSVIAMFRRTRMNVASD